MNTTADRAYAVAEAVKVFEAAIRRNEACTDNARILAWDYDGGGLGVCLDDCGRIFVGCITKAAPVDTINHIVGNITNGSGDRPVVVRRQDALLRNTAKLRAMIADLNASLEG
jgi:hypothetical protein